MTRLAQAHGAVNLAQGFPDFPAPDFVKEAAVEEIQADHNQYARSAGDLTLTEAVSERLLSRYGLSYDPTFEIGIFCGATEAIHCAIGALCDPGDEVVMLEPFYDSYPVCCGLAGAHPRLVRLRAPDFRFTPRDLEEAFSPATRVVLINTPHNPTGRALGLGELELIAGFCRRYDAICVTDEVYDEIYFETPHTPMATLPGMRERTITIGSIGKTFSVTGWKVGFASGPRRLMEAVTGLHQYVTFAAPTPFQRAAARALRAPASYFEGLRKEYRLRRDFLAGVLRDCGFGVSIPEGTYFIMADTRPLGAPDAERFCREMVARAGVAAVPASALYRAEAFRPVSAFEHQAGDDRAASASSSPAPALSSRPPAAGSAAPETGARPTDDEASAFLRFAFCKTMPTLEEAARRLRAMAGLGSARPQS